MKHPFAIALTLTLLSLAACGGGSSATDATCSSTTTFPVSALSTVTSDSGKLTVAVHTAPYQPLVAGLACVELVVTDRATGASVDGLTVTMTPWMPAMGHGASVTPQTTAMGEGRYLLSNVSVFMPGEWQLRTKLSDPSTPQGGDSVEPTFSVD